MAKPGKKERQTERQLDGAGRLVDAVCLQMRSGNVMEKSSSIE